MQNKDIISIIEKFAPLRCQAPWDKSGLQAASLNKTATRLAVFLDPLPKNIKKAMEQGADFLLAHHPLAIKPELPKSLNNYRCALKLLLCNDLPLYSAHTSLDVSPFGPANWLGKKLGIKDIEYLEKLALCPDSGYGGIGNLPAPMQYEEFIDKIMGLCSVDKATLSGAKQPDIIKRVAWCGGSGESFADMAQHMGADIFITGDVKYHTGLDAEIAILDVGHHSMEEEMMRLFAQQLQQAMPDLSIIFIASKSPFNFILKK